MILSGWKLLGAALLAGAMSFVLLLVALLVLFAAPGCAAIHTPPPSLTGPGITAYYANEVAVVVGEVQSAAIKLNAIQICPEQVVKSLPPPDCHPLLSDVNTRIVVDGVAGIIPVLRNTPAGWPQTILAGIDQIEQRLDASGSVRILPYLQAARMILRSYTP